MKKHLSGLYGQETVDVLDFRTEKPAWPNQVINVGQNESLVFENPMQQRLHEVRLLDNALKEAPSSTRQYKHAYLHLRVVIELEWEDLGLKSCNVQ